jgi:ADP-ribose pyrophosphatase YjhB (NUDIX family)
LNYHHPILSCSSYKVRLACYAGEEIHEAAVREVLEETGVNTRFKSIVAFRHAA